MRQSIGVLAKLPKELHYLIEPAFKYGVYQTEDERYRFLRRATSDEISELGLVADRYRANKHSDAVADFFDDCPITDFPESAMLYWLFGLMHNAGFALSPPDWNTVESHVKKLSRFGSYRRASERMHAVKFLADLGEIARPAIPAIRRALEDEDLRVQVWAHYALAVLEGNDVQHEKSIEQILEKYSEKDELDCYVHEAGAEANAALENLALWRDTK